jgi:D-cysteine desulfhydrase
VLDRIACGAYYVPIGGSTVDGALGYADAALELMHQVACGVLPEPRVVVAPLGSGGTVGGLAAGFAVARARTRVRGITVAEPGVWIARKARRLAAACVRRLAGDGRVGAPQVDIDDRFLGPGYGHATRQGEDATELAARYGLHLDSTYTAKTFAAVARLGVADGPVLYWHTLSSAPMAPLLVDTPLETELAEEVRALLLL